MPNYVALLRAVSVGGTGKLPMAELKAMCIAEGFEAVQTYIASGNVVFSTELSEVQVKAALEKRLQTYADKPVAVPLAEAHGPAITFAISSRKYDVIGCPGSTRPATTHAVSVISMPGDRAINWPIQPSGLPTFPSSKMSRMLPVLLRLQQRIDTVIHQIDHAPVFSGCNPQMLTKKTSEMPRCRKPDIIGNIADSHVRLAKLCDRRFHL